VCDSAGTNGTILSLSCQMSPLAHVGGFVAVEVNRLLEGRIGSSVSLQVRTLQLVREIQHML
jgi:hypothetical protein